MQEGVGLRWFGGQERAQASPRQRRQPPQLGQAQRCRAGQGKGKAEGWRSRAIEEGIARGAAGKEGGFKRKETDKGSRMQESRRRTRADRTRTSKTYQAAQAETVPPNPVSVPLSLIPVAHLWSTLQTANLPPTYRRISIPSHPTARARRAGQHTHPSRHNVLDRTSQAAVAASASLTLQSFACSLTPPALQKAPAPQGHPVQDRQGFPLRAG